MSDSLAVSFERFDACGVAWKKLNDQSPQVLLSILPLGPTRESTGETECSELKALLGQYEKVLASMYQEYSQAQQLHTTLQHTTLQHMNKRLAMYDEEYMLKSSIGSILSQPGFVTQKHLTGMMALWSNDIYITK
ncbi:hypothetical protein BDF14DRAFT_1159942 [Spinellus fusiger]|nr:hypothetical protein BDF14DRAFT_1159942 [Spinellus fusiger]